MNCDSFLIEGSLQKESTEVNPSIRVFYGVSYIFTVISFSRMKCYSVPRKYLTSTNITEICIQLSTMSIYCLLSRALNVHTSADLI